MNLHFQCHHDRCTFDPNQNGATQNCLGQIELIDSSIERLDRSLVARGKIGLADSNFPHASLRFPCYGTHAKPNAELYYNPVEKKTV